MRRYQIVLLWACFICLDMIVACCFAEIWTRLFIPVQNTCYSHDRELGDIRCPNQQTYGYVEPGYSNILYTNSLGMHDIERDLVKKKGTVRIHYYGDSLISGIGVPRDKTIPSLVEEYLQKNISIHHLEVANMAPAEDSTAAQLLTYRRLGKKYSPDVVICHFMADFRDNIFETHQRTRSPYFVLSNNRLQFVPPVPVDLTTPIERLKKSSLLVRLLANKLLSSKFYNNLMYFKDKIFSFTLQKKSGEDSNSSKASLPLSESSRIEMLLNQKAWPITMRILLQFKKEAEENGSQFILIDGFPFKPNIAGSYKNTDLEQFCNTNKITYIPVYNEYQALKNTRTGTKLFLKDGHPTIAGNEALSRIIAQKLEPVIRHILLMEHTQ